MTPNPLKGLTTEKRVFNCRLSRMRCILENGFGILANCWRVFRRLNLKKLKMLHLLIIIIVIVIIINSFKVGKKNTIKNIFLSTNVALKTWLI